MSEPQSIQRQHPAWFFPFFMFCSLLAFGGCKENTTPPNDEKEPAQTTTLAAPQAPLPEAIELAPPQGALELKQIMIGRKLLLRPTPPESPTWERMYGLDYVAILDTGIREDGRIFVCSGNQGLIEIQRKTEKTPEIFRAYTPDPERIQANKPGFSRCEHLSWSEDIVYASHRGDWFIPTSFVAAFDSTQTPPTPLGLYEGRNVEGIAAMPGYVFAAEHADGVTILAQRADKLERVGRIEGLKNAWDVAIEGQRLFVADGNGILVIYNIEHPSNPVPIGSVATGGTAQSLVVDPKKNLAFVATGSQGVAIIDVHPSRSPSVIHRIRSSGTPTQVSLHQDLLAVAHWQGLSVIDVSTPRAPTLIATHEIDNERGFSRTMTAAIYDGWVVGGEWFGVHLFRVVPSIASPPVPIPWNPVPRPELEGQPAPEVEATLLDGTPWKLSDHKGKPVLLAYFATFCPLCLVQLADIEEHIWKPLQDRDITVIGLGVNETPERIRRFLSQSGITFPVGIARDGLEEGLIGRKDPGISQYPFDVIIGPDGRITYQSTRYEGRLLRKAIESLLVSPR